MTGAARGVVDVAAESPDRPALVCADRTVTYGELDADANRWARVLAGVGVGPGDRVAVMGGNRPELFACYYGAGRLGALIVPVSYRFTPAEVAYVTDDSGAVAFVGEDDSLGELVAKEALAVRAAFPLDGRAIDGVDPSPCGEFAQTLVTTMPYTSGTSGRPKGITRPVPTALNEFPRQPFADLWGFTRDDVHLLAGPAYHTAPGNYALMHLNEGAKVVVMDHFTAEDCLDLIERERVTTSHMVPANFIRLLEADWASRDRSSVRKILHAAAPCPVAVKRRILEVFPGDAVWEYFGMSEGFVSMISPEEWRAKPGSVGKAIPGLEVKILDDEGNEVGPGQVGTIWVSALAGYRFSYHNAEAKTADAWKGDFFTVGDLGSLDEDGYLYIADRRTDLIISGGVNIYPAEIEAALVELDDVVDAAVFGLPDDRMGQRVHAVVELRPGAERSADALLDHLGGQLAAYKLPRTVEFVDLLPREPNGKVLKRKLRDERLGEAAAAG